MICTKNVIEPMCKKSIFKKLLLKLTKECTFSLNSQLIKQIDACPMGCEISVVFADIYVCKMEDIVNDVVVPIKPIFYKRYVDDTYGRRNKNTKDEGFENLNRYHGNIKLTIEENPSMFREMLDIIRGGSRAAATSKMESFVTIVNGFQHTTIITRHSILDVAAALDPPLIIQLL